MYTNAWALTYNYTWLDNTGVWWFKFSICLIFLSFFLHCLCSSINTIKNIWVHKFCTKEFFTSEIQFRYAIYSSSEDVQHFLLQCPAFEHNFWYDISVAISSCLNNQCQSFGRGRCTIIVRTHNWIVSVKWLLWRDSEDNCGRLYYCLLNVTRMPGYGTIPILLFDIISLVV